MNPVNANRSVVPAQPDPGPTLNSPRPEPIAALDKLLRGYLAIYVVRTNPARVECLACCSSVSDISPDPARIVHALACPAQVAQRALDRLTAPSRLAAPTGLPGAADHVSGAASYCAAPSIEELDRRRAARQNGGAQ